MNMKITKYISVLFAGLVLGLAATVFVLPTTHAQAASIVSDNFNTYVNGSVVGQGGWSNYVNGANWIVQGNTTFEGAKALYNATPADSLIGKSGPLLLDGKQVLYIKTNNRSGWDTDAGLGVKISKGLNSSGAPGLAFAAVDFKKDGNVRYYDQSGDVYRNFATYNDDEWTLLEIQWRSSDTTARYRVNNGAWTTRYVFANTASFTGFNYVNLNFYLPAGSGAIYVDSLAPSRQRPRPRPRQVLRLPQLPPIQTLISSIISIITR